MDSGDRTRDSVLRDSVLGFWTIVFNSEGPVVSFESSRLGERGLVGIDEEGGEWSRRCCGGSWNRFS
jgi:hypothetical protein